ncbi:hypothetical protein DPMN_143635 [Dreissena polymorpha]|uniref:Uncharacterized protein n=1 Tax=Dreissena polymorpha TaxID=45954 RepID=A0A9D4GGM9_DREPO|nr:hypothetical protein DPMN_143635 [Dreissena polymorpha]
MWAILSVVLHVLNKDPSASTSSRASWALLENTFARSSCLCDCPGYNFENRQRVN